MYFSVLQLCDLVVLRCFGVLEEAKSRNMPEPYRNSGRNQQICPILVRQSLLPLIAGTHLDGKIQIFNRSVLITLL